MKRATKKNFHLPLQEGLYDRLQAEAARSGLPATVIAREAIAAYLSRKQQETIDQAIHDYAQRGRALQADIDPALEEAGVDFLLGDEEP